MKKNSKNKLIKYCFLFFSICIVSGCASKDKQSKLIAVQKRRIHVLENRLQKTEKRLDRFKSKQWLKTSAHDKKRSLRQIKSLISQRKWIPALKKSSQLKKKYPKSITLRRYRFQIFKGMGLKKQALKEKGIYDRLRAQKSSKGSRSL